MRLSEAERVMSLINAAYRDNTKNAPMRHADGMAVLIAEMDQVAASAVATYRRSLAFNERVMQLIVLAFGVGCAVGGGLIGRFL